MEIRNVAIIAHVDHGKTTLVDGLLKQAKTFRENEAAFSQTLLLDTDEQEKERGITILAKNTAVTYNGVKINIIDTPGHADFGGEVERTLNMADGAVLIIDAQEGPMPQTKFVLQKALDIGLKIIVVINKIDKPAARVEEVVERTQDLFLELAKETEQLDFPIIYAVSRAGKAWTRPPADIERPADLAPVFQAIIKEVPPPRADVERPFQLLVTSLDSDSYQGKYVIGRVNRGTVSPGQKIVLLKKDGSRLTATVERVYVSQGLRRLETDEAVAGDIVALTGVEAAEIGETLADIAAPEALPAIEVEEPTLKMSLAANTSPFAGREGTFVTSRQLRTRILKELETNIALKYEPGERGDFIISGRGELHLSVFIEKLRREGFELEVGKPRVITKIIDGIECEPVEELTVDAEPEYVGALISEVGRRGGRLLAQTENAAGGTRLLFEITTRGLLGFRSRVLNLTRGTAVISTALLRYERLRAAPPRLRNGVLVASESGKAAAYGLSNAEKRGTLFIGPQTQVYEGMIVGLRARAEDLAVNVSKEKKLTNMRAAGADENIKLTPPTVLSLEQCLDFLEADELLEATPRSLRLRKQVLRAAERAKIRKHSSAK